MRRNEMTPEQLREMRVAVESMERTRDRRVHFYACGSEGPGYLMSADRTAVTCEACLKKLGLKRLPAGFKLRGRGNGGW